MTMMNDIFIEISQEHDVLIVTIEDVRNHSALGVQFKKFEIKINIRIENEVRKRTGKVMKINNFL